MNQQHIPRGQWASFCADFTRRQRGARVTLEVEGQGGIKTRIAQDTLFNGISYEESLRTLRLMLGDQPGRHMTRAVVDPASLTLLTDERGAVEGLELRGGPGITTLQFGQGSARRVLDHGEETLQGQAG